MNDVIANFLIRWETRQLQGYIPCKKRNFTGSSPFSECGEVIASSGVTIGTGVDLGQQSAAGLEKMGIPAGLIKKFTPYLGKSKLAAVKALEAAPLCITHLECNTLDKAVHDTYTKQAATRYNKVSAVPFADIPAEAQAVVVSLGYQLGAPSKYPKAWGFLTTQDWPKAADELINGFTKYANRRKDEGQLLLKIPKGA